MLSQPLSLKIAQILKLNKKLFSDSIWSGCIFLTIFGLVLFSFELNFLLVIILHFLVIRLFVRSIFGLLGRALNFGLS